MTKNKTRYLFPFCILSAMVFVFILPFAEKVQELGLNEMISILQGYIK